MMPNLLSWVLHKARLKKCRGKCGFLDYHTAHLSRYGQWYYIDRYKKRKSNEQDGNRGSRPDPAGWYRRVLQRYYPSRRD